VGEEESRVGEGGGGGGADGRINIGDSALGVEVRVGGRGDSSTMAIKDDGEESTERPVTGRMLRPEDGEERRCGREEEEGSSLFETLNSSLEVN
jgi:hypothetical protein